MTGRDGSLDQPLASGPAPIDQLASEQATPEQVLAHDGEHRALAAALRAAVAELTPREQLVIHKRYFEDVKETFETIG